MTFVPFSCSSKIDFLPVAFGCATTSLNKEEKELFKKYKPYGLILFSRNITDRNQTKDLVKEFSECIKPNKPYVFIDQESGDYVQRMPWLKRKTSTMQEIGKLYEQNHEKGLQELQRSFDLINTELNYCNINFDCVPELDVYVPGITAIFLKKRCISNNIETIIEVGNDLSDIMKSDNIFTTGKHIPGHGRATVNSHTELPYVSDPKSVIAKEAATFQRVKSTFYMVAHILYEQIDPKMPSSLSSIVVNDFIRQELDIQAPLISDDICMGALKKYGTIDQIAAQVLNCGIDIALHCNGVYEDMLAICEKVDSMDYTIRNELQPYLP